MIFKKKVYLFFSIVVFIIASIGLTNYIIDPFQIFHKHDYRFYGNQRYQNVGLINSYLNSSDGYNSIIIGTSMTENFVPSEMENLLGWGKVLKLSARGSSLFTQKKTIDKALRTGKVKHVLWLLNSNSFQEHPTKLHASDRGFENLLYLYDENPFNDINYLLNFSTFNTSIAMIINGRQNRDIDRLYCWGNKNGRRTRGFNEFSSDKNIKKLQSRFDYRFKKNRSYEYAWNKPFPALDPILLSTIRDHPEVKFILALPPYSFFRLGLHYPHRFALIKSILDEKFTNVKIFGFDNEEFVKNMYHYKDPAHYSEEINSYMIYKMSKNKNQITLENFDAYTKSVIDNLNSYKKVYSKNNHIYSTYIEIKEDKNTVSFIIHPKTDDKKAAFYLYNGDERVSTQWYSKNLTYQIDKHKFSAGKYRVKYFLINEKFEDASKSGFDEVGYSKYFNID